MCIRTYVTFEFELYVENRYKDTEQTPLEHRLSIGIFIETKCEIHIVHSVRLEFA